MKIEDAKIAKNYLPLYLIVGCVILILVAISCNSLERLDDYMGWKDDNILEETAEFILEREIGIEIDFTPRSDE